jgi:hypothetical protein
MTSAAPPSEIRSTQGRFGTLNSVVSVMPGVVGFAPISSHLGALQPFASSQSGYPETGSPFGA